MKANNAHIWLDSLDRPSGPRQVRAAGRRDSPTMAARATALLARLGLALVFKTGACASTAVGPLARCTASCRGTASGTRWPPGQAPSLWHGSWHAAANAEGGCRCRGGVDLRQSTFHSCPRAMPCTRCLARTQSHRQVDVRAGQDGDVRRYGRGEGVPHGGSCLWQPTRLRPRIDVPAVCAALLWRAPAATSARVCSRGA